MKYRYLIKSLLAVFAVLITGMTNQAFALEPAQGLKVLNEEIHALMDAEPNQPFDMPFLSRQLSPNQSQNMRFTRIELYAPQHSIVEFRNHTRKRLQSSNRLFFLSTNTDINAALEFDMDKQTLSGHLYHQDMTYHLIQSEEDGVDTSIRLNLHRVSEPEHFDCQNDLFNTYALPISSTLSGVMRPEQQTRGTVDYQAHIAVDTDNELMWNQFANDSTAAINWFESVFLNMNVNYVSELDLTLTISSLFLRVDPTPAGNPDFNADPAEFNRGLTQFSNYWNTTHPEIDRVFAMLFSGFQVSGDVVAGAANQNVYCDTLTGYNYVRVGSAAPLSFVSLVAGHELGHNLGSHHTHCEPLGPGGTFVDECYANEDFLCYDGITSCPAGNVGTLMSYCHAPEDGFDGAGPQTGPPADPACDTSAAIHPLISSKLRNLIQVNYPQCIRDLGFMVDLIFQNAFE